MRVLVTDGEMNKSLAVVRAIADAATAVGVASRFPVSPAGLSRHADARHWIREGTPRGLVEELNRIATAEGYDQLLPVGGRTFETVSEHRDRLDLPVEEILPDEAVMEVALEKDRTYALADRAGVPAPASKAVTDADDVAAAGEAVGYPAIVKAGVETEPRYVRKVGSTAALERAYRDYARTHDSAPIVQEYLPGTARGYFGLYVDGQLHDGYAHRRIREYPPEGGASACAASERDQELREYSRRLLGALDWTGVAMTEFKEGADGTPKLVEINPKFWGSLDLAIASGMNFPVALLRRASGASLPDLQFEPRRVHWPLSGDLTHAWRRPETAPDVLADLVSPRTESNLRLGDPLPHVLEAAVTLARRDV